MSDTDAGAASPRMSIQEFAAACREKCTRLAQGHDGEPCGALIVPPHAEPYWAFCGNHWGHLLHEPEAGE